MTPENKQRPLSWRLAAILPVFLAAFLTIVGTGDDGSDDFVDCGPAEVSNTNFSAEENFAFDIGVLNHVTLLLRGKHGNIDITGDPGTASIMVTGTKRVLSASIPDAQAHLPQLRVQFEDLNTQALFETDYLKALARLETALGTRFPATGDSTP